MKFKELKEATKMEKHYPAGFDKHDPQAHHNQYTAHSELHRKALMAGNYKKAGEHKKIADHHAEKHFQLTRTDHDDHDSGHKIVDPHHDSDTHHPHVTHSIRRDDELNNDELRRRRNGEFVE